MDENIQLILNNHENKMDDHEDRLRKLEGNAMEMKCTLASIEKKQTETNCLILEQYKEQSKLINKMLDQVGSTIKTDNKIKLYDKKEFWAIAALITGYILKIVVGS